MQITIDTKTDSLEDIQKVVHLLTNILERKGLDENLNSQLGSNSEGNSANLMSMFDAPDSKINEKPNTPPNFSSFLNLINNGKREERGPPGIQVY